MQEGGVSSLRERYRAAMVLGGAGDAIGYRNGKWEFLKDGATIHAQLGALGGLEGLRVNVRDWRVSDDTVMHIATAQALVDEWSTLRELEGKIAARYVACQRDMDGRAPGEKTMEALMLMEGIVPYEGRRVTPVPWDAIPYNPKGGGCGGAMRAMAIGLRFPGTTNRDTLIEVAIESGRMTHNHPVGFLGALASALFAAFAVEGRPLVGWGSGLLEILPKAKEYLKKSGRNWEQYQEGLDYFETAWLKYLQQRGLLDEEPRARFPSAWGVRERDAFYKTLSFDGWAGSSGHDSVMIAYDVLLGIANYSFSARWDELLLRGALHAGDSDSTGSIAASLYGALYGTQGVRDGHVRGLEYRNRLEELGDLLYVMSQECATSTDTLTSPKSGSQPLSGATAQGGTTKLGFVGIQDTQGWACTVCTFINWPPERQLCSMCDSPKN